LGRDQGWGRLYLSMKTVHRSREFTVFDKGEKKGFENTIVVGLLPLI
jgi:hypothetical protein